MGHHHVVAFAPPAGCENFADTLPPEWRHEDPAKLQVTITCNEEERDVFAEPSEAVFAAIVKAFDTDIKAVTRGEAMFGENRVELGDTFEQHGVMDGGRLAVVTKP